MNLYGFVGNVAPSRRDYLGLTLTHVCEWPQQTVDWLTCACPFIKALAARHGIDPLVLANSLGEENATPKGGIDAIQDCACLCNADIGNSMNRKATSVLAWANEVLGSSSFVPNAIKGKLESFKGPRDADLGPANINLTDAQKILRQRGWDGGKQTTSTWLLTNEGTADVGAVLQKEYSSQTRDIWEKATDPNERIAMQTNVWRAGPARFREVYVEQEKSKPGHIPTSDNDVQCLKKRIDGHL